MVDTNLVLMLSDGQANEGETDLEKIGQRAMQARKVGILTSTLGVGDDYNEALMTEIANQGGGRFYHIEDARKIPVFVAGELGEVAALAARNVEIHLTVPAGATLIPLSAAYPVRQEGDEAVISAGDIPCDTELEIPIRLALLAQKAGSKLSLDGKMMFQSPAGNAITTPVNRVTVRFMKAAGFQLREGVVQPVAEKVFEKMKATSVLGVSRIREVRPGEARRETEKILVDLEAYGELLGKDWAKQEIDQMQQNFVISAASPAFAKQIVRDANRSVRSSKDFTKKK